MGDANAINGNNNDFSLSSNGLGLAPRTRLNPHYVENLGISYSASTFSVTGANSALASSNPAYVVLPSAGTVGQKVLYQITANQSFVDDSGSSTIAGNTFGTTAGTGWGNDMPFYIYAVSNASAGSPETAINFMIARIPNLTISPVAGKIGKTGSAVADSQGSMFAFGNPTVSDYASSPCLCIGSFRMQKTTAGTDDWTVSALATSDGIGEFNTQTIFTYPTGQNGNATGSYASANGGTAPIWNAQDSTYQIEMSGRVNSLINMMGTVTTDGVGAVTFRPNMPLAYTALSEQENQGIYFNNVTTIAILYTILTPSSTTVDAVQAVSPSTAAALKNSDFTAALAASGTLKFSFIANTS